jgi:molybdenum cofactor cytidylyltransferase
VSLATRAEVDALVLAAGRSARMAPHHKLLAVGADGRALIAATVAGVRASAVRGVWVVLGHHGAAVARAAGDPGVGWVLCEDFDQGLSRSLRAGLLALPEGGDAVLVCLGDMPLVGPAVIDALIAAWRPGGIVVPVFEGRRGNPVLWDRGLVAEMLEASGDQGGRELLRRHADRVCAVVVADDAVLRDADTPAALRALPGGPWRAPDGTLI